VVGGDEWSSSPCSNFTPGKEPLYPLIRRLGVSQSWSGCFGEETNILPLLIFEPLAI